MSVRCSRQHHIVRLDARQLLENGARRVAEAGALLPHLKALPQYEGEKAHHDMSLNAVLALVPDRANIELTLLDFEGGFDIS
jgi:hypothetical protein